MNNSIANNEVTIETLLERVTLLEAQLAAKPKSNKERDYGPKAVFAMDDLSAWRIMYGDLKATKVRKIADDFGFSRGQVYSVRGTYTFTHINKDSFTMDDVKSFEAQQIISALEA